MITEAIHEQSRHERTDIVHRFSGKDVWGLLKVTVDCGVKIGLLQSDESMCDRENTVELV